MNKEAEHHFARFMEEIGLEEWESDAHLSGTPRRVAEAFENELFAGLSEDPREPLQTTFPADEQKGLVVVDNIEVQSVCAHHFLPIQGKAHVGYVPKDKMVGLSKFSRTVERFARRPQVQERLTQQVVDAVYDELDPLAAIVVVIAEHECMKCRGVREPDSATRTSEIRGELSERLERKFYDLMDLNGV